MCASLRRCRCSCCRNCLSWLYYAGVGALAQWRKFTGRMSPLHSALFQLTLLALLVVNITSVVLNHRRLLAARARPSSSLHVEHLSLIHI